MVIGKFFSATQLGFFSRAQTFAALPSSNITNILQRVTFPVLSMIQNDEEGLRRNYRKILRTSAFIIFPMMMGLCALASPLINVVLTSKWNGCVLYLQIICLAMMWYPVHALNINASSSERAFRFISQVGSVKKDIGSLYYVCHNTFRNNGYVHRISCQFSVVFIY
jgi:teichuronic acid exporter